MGTSKIAVEFAMGPKQAGVANDMANRKRAGAANEAGHQQQQPPNKRAKLSTPSSAKASSSTGAPVSTGGREVTFEEFMAVMQPKSKRRTWANDDGVEVTGKAAVQMASAKEDSDDEDVQDLTKLSSKEKKREKKEKKKRKEKEAKEKVQDGNAAAHPAEEEGLKPEADQQEDGGEDEEARDTEMTDAEYLASRMRRHVGQAFEEAEKEEQDSGSSSSSSEDDSDAEDDPSSSTSTSDADPKQKRDQERIERAEQRAARAREEQVKKEQEAVDIIMTTSRLLVRNLAFATTEDELKEWFEQWGEVRYVSFQAFAGVMLLTFGAEAKKESGNTVMRKNV